MKRQWIAKKVMVWLLNSCPTIGPPNRPPPPLHIGNLRRATGVTRIEHIHRRQIALIVDLGEHINPYEDYSSIGHLI